MEKTYCIYKHTNKINGKIYIGQTCQKPEHRWGKQGQNYTERQPLFYSAIQKYGWDNFEHTIIIDNLTQEEANQQETYWINYYQSNILDYGYNLTSGGDKTEVSIQTREKLSQKRKDYLTKHPDVLSQMRESSLQAVCKSIICLETGIVYQSAAEASKDTGIDYRDLSACCNHKKYNTHKTHWEFYNEEYLLEDNRIARIKELEALAYQGRRKGAKQVLCVETGEIFNSATEAGKIKKINFSNICAVCRGDRNIAGGYHWKYVVE